MDIFDNDVEFNSIWMNYRSWNKESNTKSHKQKTKFTRPRKERGFIQLTVADNVNDDAVSVEDLIRLHNLSFKLIPLDKKGKPVESWTPIYDNPEYWTRDQLASESYKFKNVATCFGKTHLRDTQGRELYLNCLDIDSDNVYKILFNLENGKSREQYSFVAMATQRTL